MSTTLNDPQSPATEPPAGSRCQVAIFYEDTPARNRAVMLGDHLVQHFWSDLNFDFTWWRFRYLADPGIAEAAGLAAIQSRVLIISAGADSEVPNELNAWLEQWPSKRHDPEGVIVPLLHPANAELLSVSPWMTVAEVLAQQTGMECLLPSRLRDSSLLSETARQLHQQEHLMSGVLDEILQQRTRLPPSSPHWGLNE